MTSRQWLLLFLLAVVGYGALAWLFPRYDPSARWQFQLDRAQALALAQAFATQQGLDVSGWTSSVRPARERNTERYLRDRSASDPETLWLSPLKIQVALRDPKVNQAVNFVYSGQGRLLSFQRTGVEAKATNSPPDKARAEQAARALVGEHWARFTFTADSEPENGSYKAVWSYPAASGVKHDVEATLTGNLLTGVQLKSSLPTPYQSDLSSRNLTHVVLLSGTGVVINVLAVLAAVLLYFLSVNRKETDHLSTLIFFALSLLLMLVDNSWTGLLDQFKRGDNIRGITNPAALTVLPYVLLVLICLFFTILHTMFWAVGEAATAKYRHGRLTVFAATLRGRWLTRPVAQNLAAGFLAGGFIAAWPYLCAALGGLPVTPSDLTSITELFTAPWPGLAALITSSISGYLYHLLLVFAFLAPTLPAYLRTPWLVRGLLTLAGVVFLFDLTPNPQASFTLKAIVALMTFLVFAMLYRHWDLLAVLTANMVAVLSIKAFGLWLQPAPSLHAAGWQSFLVLAGFGVVTLVLTRFAPAAEIEARQLLHPVEDQAERERLKAEFGVARRAQENLLPVTAPSLPGFGIAALCRPARECGGDLYDFIPLADGKLGVVVADVSGKGVPAALYMTLTKGLLRSVSEEQSDPGEILRVVNRHLYEVCKRKVFVTLFFGVLDPKTKTLTYSRAGHNPPVWRKQGEQTNCLLKAAGIGLGLNAGKSFDRVLAVETIQLSKNDLLIFYSDGITEAMNEQQEEYGEERLMEIATVTDGMGAEESLSAVFANVSNFLGKILPQDDQTLVVVRVT